MGRRFLRANSPAVPSLTANKPGAEQVNSFEHHISSGLIKPENLPAPNLPSVQKLARLISADRYCGPEIKRLTADEKAYNDPGQRELLYRALLAANNGGEPEPCTLALLARRHEEVLALARKGSEPSCRLILGLELTDQWLRTDGIPKPTPDQKKEGAAILRQLAYENPSNGFYAFSALGAIAEDDRDGQEEFYLRLLRAEDFTEPFLPQLVELKQLGHLNATAYLLAADIFSTRHVADRTEAYRRARDFAREGLYAEDFAVWAERNVENAKKIDQANLSEPWVNLLDQALIRGVTRIGAQKLGTQYPFYDQANWIGFYKRRVFPSDLTAIANPESPCPDFLESVRRAQRELNASDDRQISLRF